MAPRRTSPVASVGTLSATASFGACVPFPAPGFPKSKRFIGQGKGNREWGLGQLRLREREREREKGFALSIPYHFPFPLPAFVVVLFPTPNSLCPGVRIRPSFGARET